MGTLYLIATPIGNLEDISARALRLLGQVRLIAAEDTRQTRKLLSHFNIHTPLTSYFEHNKLEKLATVVAELEKGDIALVSDAGTPGLNDPGYELVRAALAANHRVSPIPGPSAPIAALVASGLPTDSFLYLGYLPRKAGERRRQLKKAAEMSVTLIFLESAQRLLAALGDLEKILGDRQVAVARELTKLHEEIFRGSIHQAIERYQKNEPRGEITLVVAGCPEEKNLWDEDRLRLAIAERLKAGPSPAQAAGEIANQSGWPRRRVYRLIMEIQGQSKEQA